ncbi:hypothetical protein GP486_008922 [Trichoglossum hirsutum]|uniref:Uncharacterized protein n=1 Tax=Trichoglossum hirsutum TaxID=265104 RepID=A0A9P8I5X2_9PEZI|nr:hypothetical protein GP486_008922 [Trichoglossum hirsutum]
MRLNRRTRTMVEAMDEAEAKDEDEDVDMADVVGTMEGSRRVQVQTHYEANAIGATDQGTRKMTAVPRRHIRKKRKNGTPGRALQKLDSHMPRPLWL